MKKLGSSTGKMSHAQASISFFELVGRQPIHIERPGPCLRVASRSAAPARYAAAAPAEGRSGDRSSRCPSGWAKKGPINF